MWLRRVSEREPAILRKYADVLVDLAAEIRFDEWQARVYVTLAAALSGGHSLATYAIDRSSARADCR